MLITLPNPMKTTVKIDWLSFSYPRENQDNILRYLRELYRDGPGAQSGRWHKKWEHFYCVEPEKKILSKSYPRAFRGLPEIEMTGSWFWTREDEQLAMELLRLAGGRPNRVDIAFDIEWEFPGEVGLEEAFHDVFPKRGKNRKPEFTDGEWTGYTFGYGRDSEVCMRIYNKAIEQETKHIPYDGLGWWRVEQTVRGNTLKDQDSVWWEDESHLYKLGAGFLAKTYQGWPSWFCEPQTIEIKPRKRGVAGVEGQVIYWQRRIEKFQRKLLEVSETISPLEVENVSGKSILSVGALEGRTFEEGPQQSFCRASFPGGESFPAREFHHGRPRPGSLR